jgi:hypothetical protein
MIKQLSDVSGLYARFVSSPGFVPIPFPRSTWENLGVPECPKALNLDPPPSKRRDRRRPFSTYGGGERSQSFWHGMKRHSQIVCPVTSEEKTCFLLSGGYVWIFINRQP